MDPLSQPTMRDWVVRAGMLLLAVGLILDYLVGLDDDNSLVTATSGMGAILILLATIDWMRVWWRRQRG